MLHQEEKIYLEKTTCATNGRLHYTYYVLVAAIFLRLPDTKIAHTLRILVLVKVLIHVPRSTLRLSTIN